jgi:hypothetical protein
MVPEALIYYEHFKRLIAEDEFTKYMLVRKKRGG